MQSVSFPRFYGKPKPKLHNGAHRARADTDPTISASCDNHDDKDVRIQIEREQCVIDLWRDLKRGTFKAAESIHLSFVADPKKKVAKMKYITDVFAALGRLPQLKELAFSGVILVPGINKLLKKSSVCSLKFHHCEFILATDKNDAKQTAHILENLWNNILLQEGLEVLEIIDCCCIPYQKLGSTSSLGPEEDSTFSFQIPLFLQEGELIKLKRLVLEQCTFDQCEHAPFINLLLNNASLEDLEIRPVFEVTSKQRRQQYQAKKEAIRKFMTETIPMAVSSSGHRKLKKLVVGIEDFHLEPIYAEAMASWIEVVPHSNCVLTDLRATQYPLGSSSKELDDSFGVKTDAWLHCNLQYQLRLNQLRGSHQQEINPELVAKAYDVSCLEKLLEPNPNLMDASTQTVPCNDQDDKDRWACRRQSSCGRIGENITM